MKKALIITYYWPPSGGGGVMRWLKMSRYLPETGWKPVIYTPENPDASVEDRSLIHEIHPDVEELKTRIWEPYQLYRFFTGKKKGEKLKAGYISDASTGSWKNKLSVFIRGNLLIPDPRVFWVKPSVKFLVKYLKDNPVDVIISTGPPHSMHLIALALKKKTGIFWIADFRDPWTDIDFYANLKLTRWADKKHHKLEKRILTKADCVVTVSPDCARGLQAKANRRVEVIYNGFDPDDFGFEAPVLDKNFTISHFGALNSDRNPIVLWKTLGEMAAGNAEFKKDLRIQLIGQTDSSVIKEIELSGLHENLVMMDHLPHKEGLLKLAGSQVLLLPINNSPNVKGILPGKMYEYFSLKRPVMAIGPEGADFAKIIDETKSGKCHNFDDYEGLRQTVNSFYQLFKAGELHVEPSGIERFSRKNLVKEFMALANKPKL